VSRYNQEPDGDPGSVRGEVLCLIETRVDSQPEMAVDTLGGNPGTSF
jgi:hypothetical protein